MSRTDKDRPGWVIENDDTIPMIYYHDFHTLFRTGMNYYSIYDYHFEYCTAYGLRTWTPKNSGPIPCFRYPFVKAESWWKFPKVDRIAPYRARRRDFLKRQVKIFNSNHDFYDDYDFMDDETLEICLDETSYNHVYKN